MEATKQSILMLCMYPMAFSDFSFGWHVHHTLSVMTGQKIQSFV